MPAHGLIPRYGGDVYGGWEPTTLIDLLECEQDPYITPAGVDPQWVLDLRAAAKECRDGHPAGLPPGRRFCGFQRCAGATAEPGTPRCPGCGEPIADDDTWAGHGMCGTCLHDALRSGWDPDEAPGDGAAPRS